MAERVPASLRDALLSVSRWIAEGGFPAVIVGGVAVSLLGRPRLTRDIDALAVLPESEWERVLGEAAAQGLEPRIEDPLDFAQRSRVLLLRHSASEIDVDVILGLLPFECEAVARGAVMSVGDLTVSLPRVEDLMVMKAIAHRPRDLADLEGLVQANPNADLDAVRHWVREFATAATMPDLLEDFESLVKRARS